MRLAFLSKFLDVERVDHFRMYSRVMRSQHSRRLECAFAQQMRFRIEHPRIHYHAVLIESRLADDDEHVPQLVIGNQMDFSIDFWHILSAGKYLV